MKDLLTSSKPVRDAEWSTKEVEVIMEKMPNMLTTKPVVYLVNMSMGDFIRKKNKWLPKIHAWVQVGKRGGLGGMRERCEVESGCRILLVDGWIRL